MTTQSPTPVTRPWSSMGRLGVLLDSIRFEHSIFALPFAYLGMILAARGFPTIWQFFWITIAMVAARTLAMSTNRLLDRGIDALNPRTARRALPSGLLRPNEMLGMALVSLFVFLLAAAMLNTLALILAPVAAVFVITYSTAKRFTWLGHFWLGLADGIAPAGGWIAVAGDLPWEAVVLTIAVSAWVAGFDLIYQCVDRDFDIAHRLHSMAVKWGIAASLRWARTMHIVTAGCLLALGPWLHLGWPYYVGWAVACGLLLYEHSLVKPDDLSKVGVAFFNVNGYIALIVFAFTVASLYIG